MSAQPEKCVTARSQQEGILALRNGCKHLDFTHNMHLSSNLVREIQSAKEMVVVELSKVPNTIQHLKVYEDLVEKRNQISAHLNQLQEPAIGLFESITPNAALESLHLESKFLGDASIECLCRSLSRLSHLKHLDLSANYITSIGAEALGFELQHHFLRELNLDYNQLQNSAVHRLGLAMQGNKTLEILRLRGNGIGPDLPAGLVLLLTQVDQSHPLRPDAEVDEPPVPACMLQELNLDRNCIEIIPIRLGACVNLRELTLDGNPIQTPKVHLREVRRRCLSC